MLERILACILNWSTRRLGLIELDGPLIVQDGTAWLRIAPGQEPRWYPTWEAANT